MLRKCNVGCIENLVRLIIPPESTYKGLFIGLKKKKFLRASKPFSVVISVYIYRASNHFLNVKINFREHFLHFAVMPKDFYVSLTNCVGVFCETGSMTRKKGAGRPIVRTEEIVILNKLRRTFSNP
jgi:hypothetical protein